MPSRVAILIPTMNRSAFVIRQLRYYASFSSPHPIYIGDSSEGEEQKILEQGARKYASSLPITYLHYPKTKNHVVMCALLARADAPYACYIGDDDFQIPGALTDCASFLDAHPDFSSAHGHAVTIRICDNGVYGKIAKIKDYPQPEVQDERAAQRILTFFSRYYVSAFSVQRREEMADCYAHTPEIPDDSLAVEVLPCTVAIVKGKSKLINRLQFIRQIHDRNYPLPDTFDWITSDAWTYSVKKFLAVVSEGIAAKDRISADHANRITKQAFWVHLERMLALDYPKIFPSSQITRSRTSYRMFLRSTLKPFLPLYRRMRRYGRLQMHAEVTRPGSPYFDDFKGIRDILDRSAQ